MMERGMWAMGEQLSGPRGLRTTRWMFRARSVRQDHARPVAMAEEVRRGRQQAFTMRVPRGSKRQNQSSGLHAARGLRFWFQRLRGTSRPRTSGSCPSISVITCFLSADGEWIRRRPLET